MSNIYWDLSWNPISGCTMGCPYCWARLTAENRLAGRFGYPAPPNAFRPTLHWDKVSPAFTKKLQRKKPAIIATCFMGDMFGPEGKNGWIDSILQVIHKCPQHRFLILTKQPKNLYYWMLNRWNHPSGIPLDKLWPEWVWLGISAENQEAFDRRWFYLEKALCRHKFVSFEPLHGPVDMGDARPEWVIVGGQTGRRAEAMVDEWAWGLVGQCAAHKIPLFFKQVGAAFQTTFREKSAEESELLKIRQYPPELAESRGGK